MTTASKLGYASGSGGRDVGAAHRLLVTHLRKWAKLLDGPKAMADRIRRTPLGNARATLLKEKRRGKPPAKTPEASPGKMHPSMISKVIHAKAMFPEGAAVAWANDLGLGDQEREALLDVVTLANAPLRLLELFDGWKLVAEERGLALVAATKTRTEKAKERLAAATKARPRRRSTGRF